MTLIVSELSFLWIFIGMIFTLMISNPVIEFPNTNLDRVIMIATLCAALIVTTPFFLLFDRG